MESFMRPAWPEKKYQISAGVTPVNSIRPISMKITMRIFAPGRPHSSSSVQPNTAPSMPPPSPHSDAPVLRSTAMPSQKPRPVRSVFEKIRNVPHTSISTRSAFASLPFTGRSQATNTAMYKSMGAST